jgi:hypothetical protein
MRGVASANALGDPWLAGAALGAMLLCSFMFGFVRRRLADVLATWRRDAARE